MQEANKSNIFTDHDWHELLSMAFNRCERNARRTSAELGIPLTTLLHWLKGKRIPKQPEEVKARLLAYFAKPYISGPSSNVMARIWQAMRCMRHFTAKEIIAVTQSSKNYCQQVIRVMLRCGYLKVASAENQKFILVRDTGPRPPTINKKCTAIIDNNLKQEFLISEEAA